MRLLLLLLAGCSYEFGLSSEGKPSVGGDDTAGWEPDTAGTVDTAPETGETADPVTDTATGDPPDTDPPADTGGVEDPPPEDDCAVTSDLVYVLARDDSRLYTFDPSTASFTSLGRVDCGTSQTPGSMAVSRDGVAWVRYADDAVYAVDLATLSCTPTAYSDRATRFDSFGMGYATDAADTWRDQLYVANADTLGVLDPSTWSIRTVGAMPSQSELTGNADGELWAMLPLERPAKLVRLDTASGATVETLGLPGFPSAGDIDTFAFATWNGDFYLFVRLYGMGSSTDVYRVTASGTMTTLRTDVGFDVVGAGVSTCAPA